MYNPFLSTVFGNLPTQSQLAEWEFAVSQHSAVPQGLLVCLYPLFWPPEAASFFAFQLQFFSKYILN